MKNHYTTTMQKALDLLKTGAVNAARDLLVEKLKDEGIDPDKVLPTTPALIALEAFKEKVRQAYINSPCRDDDEEDDQVTVDMIQNLRITDTICEDLEHIEFDTENSHIQHEPQKSPLNKILGYHIYKDMVFCGVLAGGDWETPIVYIVWWDGNELRGYIPDKGNPYNRKDMAAYGNSDEDPDPYSQENREIFKYDIAAMLKDISGHFQLD